ncbi:hypothetical protein FIBSPDRAFT_875747 [Athelia psychrophila]|uniref:Uncharacterized protein n=1 Tax=Athelia psychrophila TaxID=1759441 RepID=A0A167XI45_9AGAM|nr:hypothetical protein FIBSPDRAFT_875747 [Fibularhizoctonia sp. CBS 109695]
MHATAVSKCTGSRPNLWATDSQSTFVGSVFERKLDDLKVPREKVEARRPQQAHDKIYLSLLVNAQQSEYVAETDGQREWILRFPIPTPTTYPLSFYRSVSQTTAYLVTDSRYWTQA